MKRIIGMIIGGVALVAMSGAAMAAMAKSGTLERVTTIKSTGASAMETEKFYWEGDRLRAEKFSIAGTIVQIKDGKTLYLLNPDRKEAIKAVVPDKYAKTVQQMLAEEAGPIKDGKKVGAATISGYSCDVYIITKTAGGTKRTAKVWVSKDSRLPIPLKIEITMGKTTQVIETRNIKLNMNVPDTMFALPKGTKVQEQKVAPAQSGTPSKK